MNLKTLRYRLRRVLENNIRQGKIQDISNPDGRANFWAIKRALIKFVSKNLGELNSQASSAWKDGIGHTYIWTPLSKVPWLLCYPAVYAAERRCFELASGWAFVRFLIILVIVLTRFTIWLVFVIVVDRPWRRWKSLDAIFILQIGALYCSFSVLGAICGVYRRTEFWIERANFISLCEAKMTELFGTNGTKAWDRIQLKSLAWVPALGLPALIGILVITCYATGNDSLRWMQLSSLFGGRDIGSLGIAVCCAIDTYVMVVLLVSYVVLALLIYEIFLSPREYLMELKPRPEEDVGKVLRFHRWIQLQTEVCNLEVASAIKVGLLWELLTAAINYAALRAMTNIERYGLSSSVTVLMLAAQGVTGTYVIAKAVADTSQASTSLLMRVSQQLRSAQKEGAADNRLVAAKKELQGMRPACYSMGGIYKLDGNFCKEGMRKVVDHTINLLLTFQ